MRTTYDVFARKAHAEPLAHIGSVEAESDETVAAVSLDTFKDEAWVEMVAVPRASILTVFSEHEEVVI